MTESALAALENLFTSRRSDEAPYLSATTFQILYEQTHLAIYRFIYSFHGGPKEDVEDLTAETYIRAWKKRKSFRGNDDAAQGWLITIARNLVRDVQRKDRRHAPPLSLTQNFTQESGCSSFQWQIEEFTIGNEREEMLLAALQTLPAQEREMVILRYILGWRVKQIAAHYNLLENTTSVKLRRALDQLRKHWPAEEKPKGASHF